MSSTNLLLWPEQPVLSVLVQAFVLMLVLYLGRKPAHQFIYAVASGCYRSLRSWAFTLVALANRLRERNQQVLINQGEREVCKAIEREFTRVHTIVQRDLGHYPALHRQVRDAIEKIEEDYQNATDAAPLPPAWQEVVETITAIPASGDPAVNKILQNIKDAVEDSHSKTLKAYKQASAQRHKLLAELRPHWRDMQGCMEQINSKVSSIDERAKEIDQHMQKYAAIRNQDSGAVAALSASAFTQFFIAGLVLVIAVLGGLINFQLIAMPMSEMVGGTSYIGDMRTSDIAALVIILIEIAMGLFLVESLKITHLFPIVSSMDDRLRKRMFVITLSILTILAGIEASLAYMRDLLALDRAALNQALTGAGVGASEIQAQFRWIPSVGQMIMGFILPFALAFIAIPLESFIHASRIVIGALIAGLLRAVGGALRVVGVSLRQIFKLLIPLYDFCIMLPLALERMITSRNKQVETLTQEAPQEEYEAYEDEEEYEPEPLPAKPRANKSSSRKSRKADPNMGEMDLAETVA